MFELLIWRGSHNTVIVFQRGLEDCKSCVRDNHIYDAHWGILSTWVPYKWPGYWIGRPVYEWCVPSCVENNRACERCRLDLSILSLRMLSAIHHWVGVSHQWQCKYRCGETGEGAWWMGRPHPTLYNWPRLETGARPNGPNYPRHPRLEWLCIGRMKYACIVYLRKSISFAHLQINRYNGIADIDPLSPSTFPIPLKARHWF